MTVCENLFIQGRTRSGLLRAHLALVPGSGLIGSEDNADGTQRIKCLFMLALFFFAEQVLICQVLSNTGQGGSPVLLIDLLT